MNWFDVDKEGLAKLFAHKGKSFVVHELVQNAWDEEGVTGVTVSLKPVDGRPAAILRVADDAPEGFHDLTHAFTLFAESRKKNDPTKRGRFNWGEKIVLALCNWATITTTTGQVRFTAKGRSRGRQKTGFGSVFEAEIRMTRAEVAAALEEARKLIPPPGIATMINGKPIHERDALDEVEETLPTLVSDEEGNLKPTRRKTTIAVYRLLNGEEPYLYELGIPVCKLEGGERWHVDVGQKVPLNMTRDGVTPSYLRTIRVLLLNMTFDELEKEDATEAWARDAAGDERVSGAAVSQVLDLRFTEKRVAFDPSDPEANKLAVSKGYTVVSGGAMSGDEWKQARRAEAILPAGKVTPSPKPYSDDPDAEPVDVVDPADYTDAQKAAVSWAERLSEALIRCEVAVRVVRTTNAFVACYARQRGFSGQMDLNLRRLGHGWFERVAQGDVADALELLLHELGHHFEMDHLSSEYHEALCQLGRKLAELAVKDPELVFP